MSTPVIVTQTVLDISAALAQLINDAIKQYDHCSATVINPHSGAIQVQHDNRPHDNFRLVFTNDYLTIYSPQYVDAGLKGHIRTVRTKYKSYWYSDPDSIYETVAYAVERAVAWCEEEEAHQETAHGLRTIITQ